MSDIIRYADSFGIPREEALEWVRTYINRPGEFPRLIEKGAIEGDKKARQQSIQKYIREQLETTVTHRMKEAA